ncbi:MAG: glycosyltransferase [Bacteroidales bacterium]|nr:glycosyltransferase [Bacteroidales bacterium]
MKVLMFGWEFPPHISGGLGTASYGLTKSLSAIKNLEIIFVVPKLYGDEDEDVANLIGASNIVVKQYKKTLTDSWKEHLYTFSEKENYIENKKTKLSSTFKTIDFIEVKSKLQPYLSEEEFERFIKEKKLTGKNIKIDEDGVLYYEKNGEIKEISFSHKETLSINEDGKYSFSGTYGPNLIQEVYNYARVAAVIAKENDFDIIHAHDWLANAAGIAAKEVSGKPLVIHVHATEFDRGGAENIDTRVFALEQAGMKDADKIITVSNLTKNTIIKHYGADEQKIQTVYNAVEPQEAEKITYKKNVKEKLVTFLGRITYQKGPAYFVNAAKKVLDKTYNVRFVMAGNGDMFRQMIKYVAEQGIADKFHFTDFLKGDDVTKMFAISDVYVMPSVSEPFGISPLEAMRSNVPVIISKQSGVAEVIQNAVKIDYWDEDALADAIYGLIKYNGLSKMFIKQSKNEVEKMKWDKPAKEVKGIYDSLLTPYKKI